MFHRVLNTLLGFRNQSVFIKFNDQKKLENSVKATQEAINCFKLLIETRDEFINVTVHLLKLGKCNRTTSIDDHRSVVFIVNFEQI